jgi:hypothetical protein
VSDGLSALASWAADKGLEPDEVHCDTVSACSFGFDIIAEAQQSPPLQSSRSPAADRPSGGRRHLVIGVNYFLSFREAPEAPGGSERPSSRRSGFISMQQ